MPGILKKITNKNSIYLAILVLLIIIYSLNNYFWILKDQTPPTTDEAIHLEDTLQQYHWLDNGEYKDAFFQYRNYYPPLLNQFTGLIYLILNTSLEISLMLNMAFIAILCFSMYFLGKHIWNEKVGLLCAIASITFPFMSYQSHEYYLDLPSAAFAAFSLLCLVKARCFTSPGWTVGFFVATAIGLLVKWSTPFFIVVPFIIYFGYFTINLIKDKKNRWLFLVFMLAIFIVVISGYISIGSEKLQYDVIFKTYGASVLPFLALLLVAFFMPLEKKGAKYFTIGVILFFVIIWHFYAMNLKFIIDSLVSGASSGVQEGDNYSLSVFLKLFVFSFQGIPWTLFLITGILFYIFNREKTREQTVLIVGLISSFLIFYILPNKDSRYLLPMVIYTAPLLTCWIPGLKWKPLRYGLIVILIIFALLGTMGWVFFQPPDEDLINQVEFPLIASAPTREPWHLSLISTKMAGLSDDDDVLIIYTSATKSVNKIWGNSFTWAYRQKSGKKLIIYRLPRNRFPNFFYKNDLLQSFQAYSAESPDPNKDYKKVVILYIFQNDMDGSFTQQIQTIFDETGLAGDITHMEEIDIANNLKARIIVNEVRWDH
ncbi:MAG: glycosyltransferase family 39 protein [Candidatus Eremiobacteraeota bacterium]|nr:glycosyltransferase family 39 protein [Candidatus Eremiobacteraeota bacterium]